MSALQTPRLSLRPFTLELVTAAVAGRDALAAQLDVRVPADWPQPDFAEVLPVIQAMLMQAPGMSPWTRLIVHAADGTLIGTIGTHGPPEQGAVEIGYDIVPAYRRQGYALEATQAFTAWLAELPAVTRIVAECRDDNAASIRVLEKLGMRRLPPDGAILRWEMPTR